LRSLASDSIGRCGRCSGVGLNGERIRLCKDIGSVEQIGKDQKETGTLNIFWKGWDIYCAGDGIYVVCNTKLGTSSVVDKNTSVRITNVDLEF